MKRWLLIFLAIVLSGCGFLSGQAPPTLPTSPSPSSPAPSPSASFLQSIWVLSPLGLNIRDQPQAGAKVLASVAQGTQLTAGEFVPGNPGWYHVEYQGTSGWIGAKGLTTTHPQLAYGSLAAGYYFLYPASWTVIDRGADVQADSPQSSADTSTPAPGASAAPTPAGARLIVHEAKDIPSLGNIPTTPGSSLSSDQVEVYGLTTIQRTYTLTGGGYESDVRLVLNSTHAVLINFRTPTQTDLDVFTEILESFGVSLGPTATPSP